MEIDRTKSLQELENHDWGEPDCINHPNADCYEYRKIPLKDLKPHYLVRLICEEVGLEYLVPFVLDILNEDPLSFVDHDLKWPFTCILEVSSTFWNKSPDLRERVKYIYQKLTIPEMILGLDKDESCLLHQKFLFFSEFSSYASLFREHGLTAGYGSRISEVLAIVACRQPISQTQIHRLIPDDGFNCQSEKFPKLKDLEELINDDIVIAHPDGDATGELVYSINEHLFRHISDPDRHKRRRTERQRSAELFKVRTMIKQNIVELGSPANRTPQVALKDRLEAAAKNKHLKDQRWQDREWIVVKKTSNN